MKQSSSVQFVTIKRIMYFGATKFVDNNLVSSVFYYKENIMYFGASNFVDS